MAINTLVDIINWLGNPQVLKRVPLGVAGQLPRGLRLIELGGSVQSQECGSDALPDDTFFFPPQKCTFSQQSIFYPLFLNEDDRIREKRLSKLHYGF